MEETLKELIKVTKDIQNKMKSNQAKMDVLLAIILRKENISKEKFMKMYEKSLMNQYIKDEKEVNNQTEEILNEVLQEVFSALLEEERDIIVKRYGL